MTGIFFDSSCPDVERLIQLGGKLVQGSWLRPNNGWSAIEFRDGEDELCLMVEVAPLNLDKVVWASFDEAFQDRFPDPLDSMGRVAMLLCALGYFDLAGERIR